MLLSCDACPSEETQRTADECKACTLYGRIDGVHVEEHVLDSRTTESRMDNGDFLETGCNI